MVIGVSLGVLLAVMRLSVNPGGFHASAGSTSGSSAEPRCWCRSSSGTTSRSSFPTCRSASRSPTSNGSAPPTRSSRPFLAAILGLGLNEAAYMSEIVRAGIISVDQGQTRGGAGARHDTRAGDAPDRPAPGDACDPPTNRQRDDLDAQDLVARVHRHRRRAVLRAGADLECNFDVVELLVVASIWYLLDDVGAHLRPVLPRAVLRARIGTPAAADTAAAFPADAASVRTIPPPDGRGRTHTQSTSGTSSEHRDGDPDGSCRSCPQVLRTPRGAPRHRPGGRAEER